MRLRRWDPDGPAYTRRRAGRGFSYRDEAGERITDPETLQRIKDLVIPPAWTDVRICPWPHGHLQAVGTDDAGRRQYLYHQAWREQRDREKFDRMLDFARGLPQVRRKVTTDLRTRGLNRSRVLAAAVRLLDIGFFRVGGEEYAEENGSYGLTTVLRDHVRTGRGGAIVFDYPAKSGQQRIQAIGEDDVVAVLRALLRRRDPGETLLAYYQGRCWRPVRSDEVNEHLKDLFGTDVSAKDFRTWHATVLAAVSLAGCEAPGSRTARKRAVSGCMTEVAEYLGNTASVARSSYVDPRVVEAFEQGEVIDLDGLGRAAADDAATHGRIERQVLTLLQDR